ncbi:hypothetical protein AbraIFM66951_011817 [Aspergillus brasiliensis]|uniref:Uncharacterized protein n=1 Tax=Aspergillus brasiliensis TaxID=319629 RepID=A0A9W5YWR0_9EURO|nr:hypothetical protein AbraCBS73388_011980 [Aspergillus brasiliensis]GKZ48066.1 hypothetical protein AbraIFM66951_011817 [Aspergillus brasiliensis]
MQDYGVIAQSAQRVLEHIGTDCHELDGFVPGFVENVKKHAQRAQKAESTGMTKKTVSLVSTTTQPTDSATFWRSLRMQGWQRWQRGTDGAFSPAGSGSTGSSSPGGDEVALQEDRQVIIKIADQGSRERIRRRDTSERDIVKQVNERIVATAIRTPSSALAAVTVTTTRKLPSGDVALYVHTAAAAEMLRIHARGWLDAFSAGASVQIPTWGVVVRGVPTNVAGKKASLTPAEILKLVNELVTTNPAWSVPGDHARINHISWLVKPNAAKRFEAVVLEFTSPAVANRVIRGGVLWAHQSLQAVRFNQPRGSN